MFAYLLIVTAGLWVADHCPDRWGEFLAASKWRKQGRLLPWPWGT